MDLASGAGRILRWLAYLQATNGDLISHTGPADPRVGRVGNVYDLSNCYKISFISTASNTLC